MDQPPDTPVEPTRRGPAGLHSEPHEPRSTNRELVARLRATVTGERLRAIGTGPVGALQSSLMLVVAVQHFHVSTAVASLLAASGSIGFLLAPAAVALVAGSRLPVARATAACFAFAACAFALVAAVPGPLAFVGGMSTGLIALGAAVPLGIALWRANVPDARRGRFFARAVQIEVATTFIASAAFAWWVGDQPGAYRVPAAVVAGGLVLAACAAWRIPSSALPRGRRNPLAALAWLWRDPSFGLINLSMTIMGLANFVVMPLRAIYLADLGHPPWAIVLIVTAIQAAVRVAFAPRWGRVFDRASFIPVRMAINACFVAAITLFFIPWLPAQIAGSICFGLGFAGGDIAWNLWVTRYAPPDRTADYMAVHAFLTGARGTVAPFLGFAALGLIGIPGLTLICAALVIVASLLLWPEVHRARR